MEGPWRFQIESISNDDDDGDDNDDDDDDESVKAHWRAAAHPSIEHSTHIPPSPQCRNTPPLLPPSLALIPSDFFLTLDTFG